MLSNFEKLRNLKLLKDEYKLAYFSLILALICQLTVLQPVQAKRYNPDSPLTVDQQKRLKKAARYAKKGKGTKAAPVFEEVLATCNDIPKCLALAEYTQGYGHPLQEIKRRVLERAFSLCRTDSDYIHVAIKARQYESFDVTRKAIQQLISNAKTPAQILDLARKSQEVSMNDVAHLAMEKYYSMCRTVPEALEYARQVHIFGMDDLLRQVVKDLIDDENNPDKLVALLRSIEPFKLKPLNRYLLTKALDESSRVESYYAIWKAARRHGYQDIMDVCAYRAKKKKLINKIKQVRAKRAQQTPVQNFQGKVEQWRTNQAKTDGIYKQQSPNSVGGF